MAMRIQAVAAIEHVLWSVLWATGVRQVRLLLLGFRLNHD